MSVIVKGMEMPKHCYDCPLQDGETGRCNILKITVCDYIPKECPLVEVVQCKDCVSHNICGTTNMWAVPPCGVWFCSNRKRKEETYNVK